MNQPDTNFARITCLPVPNYRSLLGSARKALVALAFLMMCGAASSQDPSSTEQRQHYLDVARISTLEWWENQPFLLKADYQLYDLDGKPSEKGTAEESWGAGSLNRVDFTSSALMRDENTLEGSNASTHKRESYLVHQMLSALARPFPQIAEEKDFKLTTSSQDIAGVSFDCFSVTSINSSPNAVYCTDAQNRIVAIIGDLFVIRRTNFRKFHDHQIPMDTELSYEGRTALTMHINELDEPTVQTEIRAKKATQAPPVIPGAVLAGRYLKKINPEYPKKAKKAKIGGTVLMTAIISKQGTITSLDVIASPDSLLTESATAAVKTWTYQPYLLNGAPIEVDTTIKVNYNLNEK